MTLTMMEIKVALVITILLLIIGLLWYKIQSQQILIIKLQKDADRYNEIRKWHWADSGYVVTKVSNLSIGDDTFSVARLDEIVDDSIYKRKERNRDPADED